MVNKTQILMALLLSTSLVQAQGKEDVYEISAMKTHDLKELRLLHSNNSFAVLNHGKVEAVNPAWVDKDVRSVSTERLAKMLGHGYLSVNKMSNGEFSVKASVRGEGGGPILGQVGFWGVRVLGHGGLAVACFLFPPLLPEAPLIIEGIEVAAHVALVAGTVAPTA